MVGVRVMGASLSTIPDFNNFHEVTNLSFGYCWGMLTVYRLGYLGGNGASRF